MRYNLLVTDYRSYAARASDIKKSVIVDIKQNNSVCTTFFHC